MSRHSRKQDWSSSGYRDEKSSKSRRDDHSRSRRDTRDSSPIESKSPKSRSRHSSILSPRSPRTGDRRKKSGGGDRRRSRDSRSYHSSSIRNQSGHSRRRESRRRTPSSSRSSSLVRPRRYKSDVHRRSSSESPPPIKPRRNKSDVTPRESRRRSHYAGDDDSVELEEDDDFDRDEYYDRDRNRDRDRDRDRRRHRHSTSRRQGSSRHRRSRRSQSESASRRRHRSRRERDRSRGSDEYSDRRDKDYHDDDRRYHDEKENNRYRRSRRRRSPRRRSSSSSLSEEDDRRRKSEKARGSSRRRNRKSSHRRPKRRHSSSLSDRDNQQRDESPMEVAPRAGVVSEEEDVPPPPVEKAKKSESSKTADKSKDKSTKSKRSESQHNDDVGHFQGGKGSMLNEKYSVIREVGVGTFGRVLECNDLSKSDQHKKQRSRPDQSEPVAIKVVRNIKRYYKSAKIEADILMHVNRKGGRGLSHCVIMHEAFSFDGHYCMVFESLGQSLYDFMKRQRYQPYPPDLVYDFAKQLLETLEFIHSFKLIHTDLKPENILLVNDREVKQKGYWVPESTKIKIIDFGGATYDNEKKSSIVNTRQYRAPEVILGTGWSMESDMWSAGCILAELYQGELLFATHDNVEHLALIEKVIDRFPRWMTERGKQEELIREAFHSDGTHKLERVLEPESFTYVKRVKTLESIVYPEDTWFLSMLQRILVIDPNRRSSARECLGDSKLWTR